MQGRWSFNKLGCEDGYRSSITLVPARGQGQGCICLCLCLNPMQVPSLGLGVFAAVASTCDNYGDGDALGCNKPNSNPKP